MLIDDSQNESVHEEKASPETEKKFEEEEPLKGSKISYFQKSSPKKK